MVSDWLRAHLAAGSVWWFVLLIVGIGLIVFGVWGAFWRDDDDEWKGRGGW
jgi:hypothetical protein